MAIHASFQCECMHMPSVSITLCLFGLKFETALNMHIHTKCPPYGCECVCLVVTKQDLCTCTLADYFVFVIVVFVVAVITNELQRYCCF